VVGRGPFKIFLGYTAGVGKSFHLFDEGHRRRARGEDVVVASLHPDLPADVAPLLATLEHLITPHAINIAALLQRHPQICIVDALAHDNPPGSRHAKRYQDVEELLDAGIGVLAAIDIDAIDEQQPFVERVTGRTRADTVPQRLIESADEIVLVDAAPDVLLARAEPPADTTPAERAQQLTLLRERARQLAATVAERQLDAFLARHHLPPQRADARILVCITPHTNVEPMLASTRREAAGCHIDVFKFDDEPACGDILEYARRHDITQLFIGQEQKDHQHSWRARFGWTLIDRLIEHAGNLEIRVFPE
jgi:two-component system, OmpR family, sensor histidine kinase KdpD